jgi:hypothetical protein
VARRPLEGQGSARGRDRGQSRARIAERRLAVTFRRQRGHESTWAGRNDYAACTARADALATEAALRG